jgi:hypothetical protein
LQKFKTRCCSQDVEVCELKRAQWICTQRRMDAMQVAPRSEISCFIMFFQLFVDHTFLKCTV